MAGVETLIPAGGVGAVLALVIGYLLRQNAADRRDYQEAVDRAEVRADAAELRSASAQVALDEQRTIRRHAEDTLASSARELAAVRHELGRQAADITVIRDRLT